MAYNLTDAELAALGSEQLLELSDANIEMSRRLDAEMARRGLVAAGELEELSAHQEAAILDTLPDEVLERLPGHDGPGHTEDGPADCRRCALLREHGPALGEAARRLREEEGL